MITIRASMLPSYADCPRRAAANLLRKILTDMGYGLRKTPTSAGALVGIGVHAGAEYCMNHKLANGDTGKLNDMIELSLTKYKIEIMKCPVSWDSTTTKKNDAECQIIGLCGVFMAEVAPEVKPIRKAEQRVKAQIEEGFELSGKPDLDTEFGIEDWKSGTVIRPHHQQLGGYSLLKRTHEGMSPAGLRLWHMKRVAVGKPQSPVKKIIYHVEECERAAFATIKHVIRDVRNFQANQDPWSFAANPMSMMCSDKYCPAWGTAFCTMGRHSS